MKLVFWNIDWMNDWFVGGNEVAFHAENPRRGITDVAGLCTRVANVIDALAAERLGAIGYKIVLYPITLLLGGIKAMEDALAALKQGARPDALAEFAHMREVIGFPAYDEEEKKYATT